MILFVFTLFVVKAEGPCMRGKVVWIRISTKKLTVYFFVLRPIMRGPASIFLRVEADNAGAGHYTFTC
jgi:hypothetical protein